MQNSLAYRARGFGQLVIAQSIPAVLRMVTLIEIWLSPVGVKVFTKRFGLRLRGFTDRVWAWSPEPAFDLEFLYFW